MKYLLVFALFTVNFIACKKKTIIPVPPSTLNAVATSNTQVNLSWTDNSTNETGFKIERKSGNSTYSVIGTTNADITTFSDQTVQLNTSYTYRVYAYNSAGASLTYTNEATVFISTIPTITTTSVANITAMSASGGGNITSDGGSQITARGVCWSSTPNPTVTLSSKTNDGIGTGNYTSAVSVLNANTTYYVRAYATNANGTAYGNEISFTTSNIDLTTGLVAFYPFTGNAGDSSGNNNHGIATQIGTSTISYIKDRHDKSNAAIKFTSDPSWGSLGSYIQIQNSNNLLINSSFTINYFVKIDPSNLIGEIINKGSDAITGSFFNRLNVQNFQVSVIGSPSTLNFTPFSETGWKMITIVRESNSNARFYIDGNLIQSFSMNPITNNLSTFCFGAMVSGGSNGSYYPFQGSLDEIRFYSRVLTQLEISYLAAH